MSNSWRTRVGIVALGVSIVLVSMAWILLATAVARRGWPPEPWMSYDFRAFYGAGRTVLDGLGDRLYDPASPAYRGAPLFVNPPFYALLVAPIGLVPIDAASALWLVLSIAALGLGVFLLDGRAGAWMLLLILLSAPALHAVVLGQNTMFMFLFIALGYWALARDSSVLSGIAIALSAVKPQLIAGILVFLATRWRQYGAVLLASMGTLVALAVTSFTIMPTAWREYPAVVASLPGIYERGTVPFQDLGTARTVSLGFPEAPSWVASVAALLFGLSIVISQVWFVRRRAVSAAAGYAVGVLVSVLIAPHLNQYDWLILAIPLILLWTAVPEKRPTWLLVAGVLSLTALLAPWIVKAQLDAYGRALAPASPILLAVTAVCALAILDGSREPAIADARAFGDEKPVGRSQ